MYPAYIDLVSDEDDITEGAKAAHNVIEISDDDEPVNHTARLLIRHPTEYSPHPLARNPLMAGHGRSQKSQPVQSIRLRPPYVSLSETSEPEYRSKDNSQNAHKRTHSEAEGSWPINSDRFIFNGLKPRLPTRESLQFRPITRPGRLHCLECTGEGLECDGEQPCSRCVEPGILCIYPGAAPLPPIENRTLERCKSKYGVSFAKGSIAAHTKGSELPIISQTYAEPEQRATADSSPPSILLKKRESSPVHERKLQTLGDYKALVSQLKQEAALQREDRLRNELLRAINRAKQVKPCPSTTLKVNPFIKLIADSKKTQRVAAQTTHVVITRPPKKGVRSKLSYNMLTLDKTQPILPAYKSIGRMGTTFLTRNTHTLKHLPFLENESDEESEVLRQQRESELNERYRNNGFSDVDQVNGELIKQRRCLEHLHRWSNIFVSMLKTLHLTRDKLTVWIHGMQFKKCGICDLSFSNKITPLPGVLLSSDERMKCAMLSAAFSEILEFPIWHFAERKRSDETITASLNTYERRFKDAQPSLCVICFVPNCMGHGLCSDGDEEANMGGLFIDDPEVENNKREPLVPKLKPAITEHICGLYCLRGGTDDIGQAMWGILDDGYLVGARNNNIQPVADLSIFQGTEPCSQNCSIYVSTRLDLGTYVCQNLKDWQEGLLHSTTRLYSSHTRLPCLLAKRMKVPCNVAFVHLVRLHERSDPAFGGPHPPSRTVPIAQGPKSSYKLRAQTWNSRELKHPFMPCSHDGPCKKENGCCCAVNDAHCEWPCTCDGSCYRRFPGCQCSGKCYDNPKCLCWQYSRECDPWICKSCGVVDILDPSNKYNDRVRHGKCQNNRTQLALPARTIKGPSQVQGWGLFAGQDLDKDSYVGEYKGEIVTSGDRGEAERRGLVYHQQSQEYLFNLNSKQELDGSSFGNKVRFINHNSEAKVINIRSKQQLVNGAIRVSFWTNRAVKAGEELLYNYNYPDEVTKQFWGKGGKSFWIDSPLLPIPKPRLGGAGASLARNADEESTDEDEASVDSPPSYREVVGMMENRSDENLSQSSITPSSRAGNSKNNTRRIVNAEANLDRETLDSEPVSSSPMSNYEPQSEPSDHDEFAQGNVEIEDSEEDEIQKISCKTRRRAIPGATRFRGHLGAQRNATLTRAMRRAQAEGQ